MDLMFEDVMKLTETISSPAAFEDPECQAYFEILMTLPADALIVEVGLQFGRSSSIALQVAKQHDLRYFGIDPFTDPPEAYWHWLRLTSSVGVRYRLLKRKSDDCQLLDGETIHAILIDGDHSYDQVEKDCRHFMPLVAHGGYAMFHDFGRESLPSVYNAVRDYFDGHSHWDESRVVGTLAIFRRR